MYMGAFSKIEITNAEDQILPKPGENDKKTVVKVFGVGGWGGRIVHNLKQQGIPGFETLALDVNSFDIERINVDIKMNVEILCREPPDPRPWIPWRGRADCLSVKESVQKALLGTDILFIVAGMGRATGTGASQVIAEIARDLGILTIAVVTMPFSGEGEERIKVAEEWLEMLGKITNLTLVISNDGFESISKSGLTTYGDNSRNSLIFSAVYEVVTGITSIIEQPYSIGRSSDEFKLLMSKAGYAFVGYGRSRLEESDAVSSALVTVLERYLKQVNDYLALIKIAGGSNSFGFSSSNIQKALSYISQTFDNSEPGSFNFLKIDTAQSPDRYFQVLLLVFGSRDMKIKDAASIDQQSGIVTYLHKYKCKNCKLHFIVCSWYEWIPPAYCPECGNRADNWHWIEKVDKYIRDIVPGPEPPTKWIDEEVLEK